MVELSLAKNLLDQKTKQITVDTVKTSNKKTEQELCSVCP